MSRIPTENGTNTAGDRPLWAIVLMVALVGGGGAWILTNARSVDESSIRSGGGEGLLGDNAGGRAGNATGTHRREGTLRDGGGGEAVRVGIDDSADFATELSEARHRFLEAWDSSELEATILERWRKVPSEVDGISVLTNQEVFGLEPAIKIEVLQRVVEDYARALEEHGAHRAWPDGEVNGQLSVRDKTALRLYPLKLPPSHLLGSPLFGSLTREIIEPLAGQSVQLHKDYSVRFARAWVEWSIAQQLSLELSGRRGDAWNSQCDTAVAEAERNVSAVSEQYLEELARLAQMAEAPNWKQMAPPLGPR